MTPKIKNPDSAAEATHRHVMAWLLFPLAMFPLAALLTYDWHAIAALNTPPATSANWIGPLGDYFAYYGYTLFGLAIWVVPVMCVLAGLCIIAGRKMLVGRRELWGAVFLVAVACLAQVLGQHVTGIIAITTRLNLSDAGGAIGYIAMTRFLSPLISDFGASVVMICLMLVATVGAVGAHNLAACGAALIRWALGGRSFRIVSERNDGDSESADTNDEDVDAARQLQAAIDAKEAAKRQREEEKAAAKAEKLRIKEEKRAAKEAEKIAREEARATLLRGDTIPTETKPATEPPKREPPINTTRKAESANTAAPTDELPDKGPYLLPPLSLLNPLKKSTADHGDVGEMSNRLVATLKLFGIDAELAYTVQGPVVTKYALALEPGTKYSSVTAISDNLMGALHARSLRIEAPIPGEDHVGIEVPNRAPAGISFREIIESDTWRNFKGELPLLFGKDAAGNELIADLASMPHMLVAGATGQGKSVCLNAIINGLLMTKTPEQLKLIMVDPKSVEFTSYTSIPHLIVPIITENKKVIFSLRWAVAEMEKRLKLFAQVRVRNIYDFNHRPSFTQTDMFGDDHEVGSSLPKTVPYIVIIIDEVADLMAAAGKEVTPDIARLTAKARAAGIHLILATQRPDAKIITGTIKANIPGRVAFKTATAIDSRTILDDGGAENLIGRGDMLFKSKDGQLIRAQGAWISDPEIANITNFIEQHSNPDFDDRFTKKLSTIKEESIDPFADSENEGQDGDDGGEPSRDQVKAEENASDFKKAVECIINTNRASTSHFQRRLGWGYNHSAKIMDMLEDAGVIGPQVGAGPRQIIMDQQQLLAVFNGDATPTEEPTGEATGAPATESADEDFKLEET